MSDDAPRVTDGVADLTVTAQRLVAAGITEIHSYAWRDLDDPEAGGSEIHAEQILQRWAAVGLRVRHRTSTADRSRRLYRGQIEVHQAGGRYSVFPRVILPQLVRRTAPGIAVVEIWNGVPWLSPLWHRGPRVTWLHHVHDRMWSDAMIAPLAAAGRFVEMHLAPPVYRSTSIATLSATSAAEILALGIPPDRLTIIPPGVDEGFRPDESRRSPTPSVVIVGRLAPVKQVDRALEALALVRRRIPELSVEVVGDGPRRDELERWCRDQDATWVRLSGRVDDAALVEAYQRAWLVVSASYAEGWGMSLTEGAACATPAVATDIAGHRGAVIDAQTGVLVAAPDGLADAVTELLVDTERRRRYGDAAQRHARSLSWDSVAERHLALLADQVSPR